MNNHYKSIIYLIFLFTLSPGILLSQNRKIESIKQEIKNTKVDSIKVNLYIKLAREYHRIDNHGTKDIDASNTAVDIALKSGDSIYYARALNTLGLLYRYHRHYDIAVSLHQKAYNLIEPIDGYIIDKMIFSNNVGVAARYMSSYEIAVKYYHIALKIAEEHNNLLNIEIASNGLGNVYMNIPEQVERGELYFEQALRTAEKANNKRGISMNYLSLSSIYDNKEDYTKSREYLSKLIELNEEMKDTFGIGLAYKAFGSSYLEEEKNLNLAKKYLLNAKDVFHSIKNENEVASVNYYLGKLYYKYGDDYYASELLSDGLETAKRLNQKNLIVAISHLLFKIKNKNKAYNEALNYHILWRDYQDSLNLNEQKLQVLALNKQYDLEKIESEIIALKKEQEIQSFLLASEKNKLKNRSTILILIAALFATLFIIFFQKSQNRKFVKENTEIQSQLQAERIAQTYERSLLEAEVIATQMKINPHFLFNSLNSIKLLIQQNENSKAINYLVHLARFNRALLDLENISSHSLANELYFAKLYLELENRRFRNDFSYYFNYINTSKEELKQYNIPPLLLQPYIENAIWHGLMPSTKEHKEIIISIIKNNQSVKIEINDNGIGRQVKPLNNRLHVGRGMDITKQRIRLFNKTNDFVIKFKIIDKTNGEGETLGTCVILEISPIQVNV